MKTYILREISEEQFARVGALLQTLNAEAPPLDIIRLREILVNDSFNLFIAEDENGLITGMLTLTNCHTLAGSKYWIEDVVVDPAHRGKGIGRALVQAAVNYVKENEPFPTIYLTSNPSRVTARSLYMSEGFEEYDTGVFRIKINCINLKR
jgi:ribosomal protein S18 acetylase RimI-like enzyme